MVEKKKKESLSLFLKTPSVRTKYSVTIHREKQNNIVKKPLKKKTLKKQKENNSHHK